MSDSGCKRRRLISLPPHEVVKIVRLVHYAIGSTIVQDSGSWIRATKGKFLIDIEILNHAASSLIDLHVYPKKPSAVKTSKRQSMCEEIIKTFQMALVRIVEPDVEITDPSVAPIHSTSTAVATERITVVLVVCPFCGHRNPQEQRQCEKCQGSL